MTAESTLLRRAAETLREEAGCAGRETLLTEGRRVWAAPSLLMLHGYRHSATYTATVDPVVGAKLADLLDRIAWLDDNGDSIGGLLRDHVDALARSILRETGGE